MTTKDIPTPEMRARRRARYLAGLLWHVGAFVIINTSFLVLDAALGDRAITWAYWIAGAWGFALAFHALAYLVQGRQVEERRTLRYLAEERRASGIHAEGE